MFFGNKSMFGSGSPRFGAKPAPGPRGRPMEAPMGPQQEAPVGPQQEAPVGPRQEAPMGPQVQPAVQPPPRRPGARVAQSLMNTQFNRNPENALGAFGGAMDQIVDAYGAKNWKNKFSYGEED